MDQTEQDKLNHEITMTQTKPYLTVLHTPMQNVPLGYIFKHQR